MTDDAVEDQIGNELQERGETIAVAESCTGGLVGSLITDVPGASDYFIGGIISYMNQTKMQLLAISRESLTQHGPVSEPVAREMAQHIRDEADADWGLSTTGYAGPTSESDDESVGTVYIGIAYACTSTDSPFVTVEKHQFDGTRQEIRERIAKQALSSTLTQIRADS